MLQIKDIKRGDTVKWASQEKIEGKVSHVAPISETVLIEGKGWIGLEYLTDHYPFQRPFVIGEGVKSKLDGTILEYRGEVDGHLVLRNNGFGSYHTVLKEDWEPV